MLVGWVAAIVVIVIVLAFVDDWLQPPVYDDDSDDKTLEALELEALERAVQRRRDL